MKLKLDLGAGPVIYQISFPSGHHYVGSTTNLARRKQEHLLALTTGRHPNYKLADRYLVYGPRNMRFAVVGHTTTEDRWDAEQRQIDRCLSTHPHLLLNLELVVRRPDEPRRLHRRTLWAYAKMLLLAFLG